MTYIETNYIIHIIPRFNTKCFVENQHGSKGPAGQQVLQFGLHRTKNSGLTGVVEF